MGNYSTAVSLLARSQEQFHTTSKVQAHHERQTGWAEQKTPLPLPLPLQQALPQFGIAGSFNCLDSGLALVETLCTFSAVFFPFVPRLSRPYSSGLRRDAMLKHHILENQHQTSSREIPQYITLTTNTEPASQGSSGTLILISASRTVFSAQHGPLPPLVQCTPILPAAVT